MKRILIMGMFMALFASLGHAQPDKRTLPGGIDVIGKGQVIVKPDTFIFTITISERSETANQAKQVVDKKSDELLSLADKLYIADKDIESSQLRIRPIFATDQTRAAAVSDKPGASPQQKPALIEVSRNITFTLLNFNHYDQLLEKGIQIGVSSVSRLRYEVSRADFFYQQALEAAIDDGKMKAQRMAKQANISLGGVIYLKESENFAPRRVYGMTADAPNYQSVPAEQQISAQVQLIFEIN
ncbi:SIMPL domain-containing protein [Thalassotalea litorea]|uniref:SIMPL domain-containing protein n=1 Tax=Thalassotalea litorea TaxID=2020715 RepID=UPI0037362534